MPCLDYPVSPGTSESYGRELRQFIGYKTYPEFPKNINPLILYVVMFGETISSKTFCCQLFTEGQCWTA